jgi:hypothetical protein
MNHQIFKHCRLKGGQNFRIIIEEQYNLIILTVFKMIDWWGVLQDPEVEQLGDCSFYLNSSRLFEQDSLCRNTYYIHFIRRMNAGRKFWCIWKDSSQSILIVQVLYTMEFGKIFKDSKMQKFKNDNF